MRRMIRIALLSVPLAWPGLALAQSNLGVGTTPIPQQSTQPGSTMGGFGTAGPGPSSGTVGGLGPSSGTGLPTPRTGSSFGFELTPPGSMTGSQGLGVGATDNLGTGLGSNPTGIGTSNTPLDERFNVIRR